MVATCVKKFWMRGTNDWKNKWNYLKKTVGGTFLLLIMSASNRWVTWLDIVRSFSEIRNVHQSAKNGVYKYNFRIMFLSVKTECEDFEQLIFYSIQNWEKKKLSAWRNLKIQFHKAFLIWPETTWSNKLNCQIIFGKYGLCVLWSKEARNHLMVWGCISAY